MYAPIVWLSGAFVPVENVVESYLEFWRSLKAE
jgi:hypothetical protein